MKILKRIFLGLLALVAICLCAAAVLPKESNLVSETTVKAPLSTVHNYCAMLKNQEAYSEWIIGNKELPKLTYSGTDGTVGASQSWSHPEQGEGTMTISALTDSSMSLDLQFIKPMASKAQVRMGFTAIDSSTTKITSTFYSKNAFPFNLMNVLFADGFIKTNEDKGLANIKRILETGK